MISVSGKKSAIFCVFFLKSLLYFLFHLMKCFDFWNKFCWLFKGFCYFYSISLCLSISAIEICFDLLLIVLSTTCAHSYSSVVVIIISATIGNTVLCKNGSCHRFKVFFWYINCNEFNTICSVLIRVSLLGCFIKPINIVVATYPAVVMYISSEFPLYLDYFSPPGPGNKLNISAFISSIKA